MHYGFLCPVLLLGSPSIAHLSFIPFFFLNFDHLKLPSHILQQGARGM
jgi:hypothetical protein